MENRESESLADVPPSQLYTNLLCLSRISAYLGIGINVTFLSRLRLYMVDKSSSIYAIFSRFGCFYWTSEESNPSFGLASYMYALLLSNLLLDSHKSTTFSRFKTRSTQCLLFLIRPLHTQLVPRLPAVEFRHVCLM